MLCQVSHFNLYTLSLPPLISINFHRNNCSEASSFENSGRSRFFKPVPFHLANYRVYNFESTQDGNTRGVSRGGRTGANGTNALIIQVGPRRGNFLEWTRGTRIEREPADNIWYFRCKRPRVPTFSRREQGRGPSKPRKPSSTSVKGFQQHPRPRVGHRSLPRIAELETRMRLQGLRFLERWKGLFRIWEERIRGLDRYRAVGFNWIAFYYLITMS